MLTYQKNHCQYSIGYKFIHESCRLSKFIYLCKQGNKTCVGWAFGSAQIPASDALTHEVILTCILGVKIQVVTSLVAAFFFTQKTQIRRPALNHYSEIGNSKSPVTISETFIGGSIKALNGVPSVLQCNIPLIVPTVCIAICDKNP